MGGRVLGYGGLCGGDGGFRGLRGGLLGLGGGFRVSFIGGVQRVPFVIAGLVVPLQGTYGEWVEDG